MISGIGTPGGSAKDRPANILSVNKPERNRFDDEWPDPVGVDVPFELFGIFLLRIVWKFARVSGRSQGLTIGANVGAQGADGA
jgi:hypothetical protein